MAFKDSLKKWFGTAKDKAGDVAEKAKDVAGDVKDKVEDKIDDMRHKDEGGGDHDHGAEGHQN